MRGLRVKQPQPQLIYQVSSDDLLSSIKRITEESFKDVVRDSILNKFECVKVTSKTVCEIWDITPKTLTVYIKWNVVKPLNPGSSKLLFDLRSIIEMPNPKYRRIGKC